MFGMTLIRPNPAALFFLALVGAVYGVSYFVSGILPGHENASLLAFASGLDMVVLVPAAYYFLFVRQGRASLLRLVPVLVISIVLAAQILPKEHHAAIDWLQWALIPFEFGLFGYLAWRAKTALSAQTDADPILRFRHAATELMGPGRVARVFSSELALFYYGLFAWKAQPHQPAHSQAFSYHKRNGHGPLIAVLLMLFAIEGFAIHFLLSSWSPVFAWIMTSSTIYGGFWFVADFRAMVLRPNLIDANTLYLRSGLRFELTIPRDQIERICTELPEASKDRLQLTLLGTPTHWLHLHEPVQAVGPYGLKRMVRVVGLQADDARGFEAALAVRAASHPE